MSRPGPAAPGRRVLDDLCALRLTDRQLDAAAACLDEVRRCQESTRLLLLEHKAVLPADHTLRQLAARRGGDRPEQEQEMLGAWFRPEVDRQLAHRRLLAAELDGLRRISAERGLRATVIKGVNNARFYQDPYPRWSRDIDLFLPTWRETYELLTALRRRGYVFDERECPWMKAEPARGREEYGQLFLILRTDAGTARVDIHFGTYSVGSGEYLRCGLADFTEPLPQASDGLLGLDPTGALLVMSAHALSDGYVSVKDVNDTVEIARNRLPVDWERLAREVEAHALGPQVRLLGEYLERRYETPTVRQFGGRLTAAARCRGRSLWAVHDRRWARRAALNAGHAFRAARATGRGTPAACRGAVRCYVHYVRRLTVDTGRVPWIGLVLAASFGGYGLLRKVAALGALEGLTLETMILAPAALVAMAIWWGSTPTSFPSPDPLVDLWLIGLGPATTIPLLLFAAGARRLPLTSLGLLQYLSPTVQFLIGVWLFREPFAPSQLIGFAAIWAALVVYSADGWRAARKLIAPPSPTPSH